MVSTDERNIGAQLRIVTNLIKRAINNRIQALGPDTPPGLQGFLIGYLHERRDRDVFQRDLEAEFKVRRSSATGVLQLMEKNGLITRVPVDYDARLKKIVLTEKAIQYHDRIADCIRTVEAHVSQGLTQGEKDELFAVMNKIKRNLEETESI